LLKIEYLQGVLDDKNIPSKGIKRHLVENNFGNISGMLVESKSNY